MSEHVRFGQKIETFPQLVKKNIGVNEEKIQICYGQGKFTADKHEESANS
jgi:hypothetical protein